MKHTLNNGMVVERFLCIGTQCIPIIDDTNYSLHAYEIAVAAQSDTHEELVVLASLPPIDGQQATLVGWSKAPDGTGLGATGFEDLLAERIALNGGWD